MTTLTSIQQAKKREDRVNLYLDDEFWIGLSKDDLLALQLYKGKEISELDKVEIEKLSGRNKLIEKVRNYLIRRPRSIKEIRDYLTLKHNVEHSEISSIIDELIEQKVISDEDFAKWYVSMRKDFGIHGPKKIESELLQKGVDKSIIKNLLQDMSSYEEDKLKEYIKKLSRTIKAKDKFDLRNKIIRRMMSRGYDYEKIKRILSDFFP